MLYHEKTPWTDMTRLASFGGAGGQHACEISEVSAVLTLQTPQSSDTHASFSGSSES